MARPSDPVKSERVRLEGHRKRGVNKRDDKTFAWLDNIPAGKRFEFAWELMTAALNGELGPVMQQAVEESDLDKARMAAKQIFSVFVTNDED